MDVSGALVSAVASIHWAAIISDAATTILVGATAALVWATTRYLKPSITLAREAVRARVDDQAPRVMVVRKDDCTQVFWVSTAGGDPQPAEGASLVLRIPAQEDQRLLVEVTLFLMNEGVGSGYVKVVPDPARAEQPGVVRVIPPDRVLLHPASAFEQRSDLVYPTGPPPVLRFRVQFEMAAKEWLASQEHNRRVQVLVHDLFEDGVADVIPVTITATALVMNPRDAGAALIRLDPPPVKSEVRSIHRRYRGEPSLKVKKLKGK
jgi:hypothetical protein